ncbi:MAG TPA: GH116 family glycosyl hydrolase [Bacteroidota bacterium]|nr:GH116 family glycosyl hydrolase [Bacteroidota bacterium]
MKLHRFTLLPIATTLVLAQQPAIPAFKLESNDLEMHRLAQPGTYFDKVGRKFAVLGYESGSFEAWAYPLKLFRNFEFSFFIGSSTEPIRGKDIVRYVSVTPEATTLTYTYQSFTVKAIYVTPIEEAGAIILLDVNSTEPLSIVASFLPVLQPMWPAGIGGQYAYWDDATHAYLISEPTRKNHGFVGSPAAVGMSYTPAHMLSDFPNQFKIALPHPDSLRGRYIPVVMAGGKGSRDSVKAVYLRLAADPEKYYRRNVEYYSALRANTLRIATPNPRINLAFEWAKVAYDNLFVDNPDLGYGMVAGLGPSGTGGRPGFGWFFGGDAFINSFSLDSYGAYQSVKDALTFTQKWQRDDGKMAHELSQAAGYVNWWKDYPYGYIHGDTSPFYICSMYDYYEATGDADFVKRSWSSLKRAYDWSLATDENNDGLMDNKKAGLGAMEYGPLIDIQSDIYTGAVWVRAVYAMKYLARAAGDDAMAKEADQYYEKASRTFRQKFWDEKNQQYSYAFTAKGEHVDIVSPWSSVGLGWDLGDPERSEQSLEKLNSAELTTDWGIRSISNKSKYFEPLNYNYGAVWPFLTSWVAKAQFEHHLALQGFNSLMASVRHTFDNGLGYITEVFSGSQNIWPQEAVAHQGFSSASVVLPLVRGLMGLHGDVPGKHVTFAPQLPANWDTLVVKNWRVGNEMIDMRYEKSERKVKVEVERNGVEGYQFTFAPALGIGTKILAVRVNGQSTPFKQNISTQTIQPVVETTLGSSVTIEIDVEPTVELLPPSNDTRTGDGNKGLKIISTRWKDNVQNIVVEGLSGEEYRLGIAHAERLATADGCNVSGSVLLIEFPAGTVGEFVRKDIALRSK